MQQRADIAHEIMKSSPPVAVTAGATLFGITLNEWVAVVTILYVLLQIVVLCSRELRRRKERKAAGVENTENAGLDG
jgi:hypothetical protein